MTHPTDEELDEMARDLCHTGELSMPYRCEISDAITALCTQLAEANARADRAEAALAAQPSPDVAALVEAAEKLLDAYSAIVGAGNSWGDELRAALASVKGGA